MDNITSTVEVQPRFRKKKKKYTQDSWAKNERSLTSKIDHTFVDFN